MPITRIPDRYRAGLVKIRLMPEEAFAELVWALDHVPTIARFPILASRVAAGVKALSKSEIDDILRSLFSLVPSLAETEVSVETIASELIEAMRASERDDLQLPPQQEDVFKSRITSLLSLFPLNMSAKASRIRVEYPNVFWDARILSDVRPVFDKPGERPIGSVINHTLKIEYHEGGDHKEFYVALDGDDLSRLKRIVERAEIKAESLKLYLKNSEMPDLDLS